MGASASSFPSSLAASVAADPPSPTSSSSSEKNSMAFKRPAFVGGNWKCNGTRASVEDLVRGLSAGRFPESVEAVVAPVSIHLEYVLNNLPGRIQVAAQNASATGKGAFTGEISPAQLRDFGVGWVILGHSERRALFGESDEVVATKVANAQKEGLRVIACFGEVLEEREQNRTLDVVFRQLAAIAKGVADWDRVVLAYEPVWAIGTGKVASPEQAQEVHAAVRKWVAENVSAEVANKVRVIYGGSVKPANCVELFAKPDVDGFLVGGASLKPADFVKILNGAKSASL